VDGPLIDPAFTCRRQIRAVDQVLGICLKSPGAVRIGLHIGEPGALAEQHRSASADRAVAKPALGHDSAIEEIEVGCVMGEVFCDFQGPVIVFPSSLILAVKRCENSSPSPRVREHEGLAGLRLHREAVLDLVVLHDVIWVISGRACVVDGESASSGRGRFPPASQPGLDCNALSSAPENICHCRGVLHPWPLRRSSAVLLKEWRCRCEVAQIWHEPSTSRHFEGRKMRLTWDSSRAGDGDRTRVASLEGWGSTIELHPRGTLRRRRRRLAYA
jgi:hypothetical protein